jgi:peptide-methionine (S)-S-oxide reductase
MTMKLSGAVIVALVAASVAIAVLSKTPAAKTQTQPDPVAAERPAAANVTPSESGMEEPTGEEERTDGLQVATFGSGCFWCTEAVFQQLKGVKSVASGYSGGRVPNPTYRQVCTGTTGHAEVIQVTYDPAAVTYPELLEVFWKTHDPTTLNRQGADTGTQYRSVIFYHNAEQKQAAEQYKKKLDAAEVFPNPIVTEITAFSKFYPAEDYHQNYYNDNPEQGYCRVIIGPKLDKLRAVFRDKLK